MDSLVRNQGQVRLSEIQSICLAAASLPDYRAQYLFDYGRTLFAAQMYPEAFKQFAAAADAGNGLAAYTLGGLYESGRGVAPDIAQASHWYEVAGSDGYVDGFALVGTLYLLRTDPDFSQASKWFEAARLDGSPMGEALLGWAYETGNGAARNVAHAAELYAAAASAPTSRFASTSPWILDATFRLGQLYLQGDVVEKNPATAVKWFEKAAGEDYALAKTAMGYAYLTGVGYPQDYSRAAIMFGQAATQGEPYAEFDLAVLEGTCCLLTNRDTKKSATLMDQAAKGPVPEVAAKARAWTAPASATAQSGASTDPLSRFLAPAEEPAVSRALATIKYAAEHPAPTPAPYTGPSGPSLVCNAPTYGVVGWTKESTTSWRNSVPVFGLRYEPCRTEW